MADIDQIAPPTPEEETELRTLLQEEGILPADADAEPDAEPETAEVVEPEEDEPEEDEPEEDDETPVPVAAKAPPAKEEGLDRSYQSVARKEAQLVERERAIAAREREFYDARATADAMRRLSIEDPAAYYEAIGEKDTAKIAAHLYYKQHPEQAPEEFRKRAVELTLDRRITQLQKQIEERDRRDAETAAEANVRGNAIRYLTTAVSKIPDELAYIRAEASEDPEGTAQRLYDHMISMRSAGELSGVAGDENILAAVAGSLNAATALQLARATRIQQLLAKNGNGTKNGTTKPPAPVAGEKKTAPSTINNKKASALTRPRKAARSHEDDIARVLADIQAGRVPS